MYNIGNLKDLKTNTYIPVFVDRYKYPLVAFNIGEFQISKTLKDASGNNYKITKITDTNGKFPIYGAESYFLFEMASRFYR